LLGFRPDFVLPSALICLEADGEYWHNTRRTQDISRDTHIRCHGWRILRFRATILDQHKDIALYQVQQGINALLIV